MLTSQFTQSRANFLRGKWWSRFSSSMKGIRNGDPSRFSAFVAAFLDLLLSILLFLGAAIACVTSRFVKFFHLEPPCSYIGCRRAHAHREDGPHLYCTHSNTGMCHDCFFFNTFAKFGLGHYVFPNNHKSDATIYIDETGETSHLCSEGSISDEMLVAGQSGEVGCLKNPSLLSLNRAHFVCSDCDARLFAKKYRQRRVRRKIVHTLESQKICCNGLDDTIYTFKACDKNTCMEHSIDENNGDKDYFEASSKISGQAEETAGLTCSSSKTSSQAEEALALTCPSDNLGAFDKLVPGVNLETDDKIVNADGNPLGGSRNVLGIDEQEKVNKKIGGKDALKEEGCSGESGDNCLFLDLHCQNTSFIQFPTMMATYLSENTLRDDHHVARNGTLCLAPYHQDVSVEHEQNMNIKEDGHANANKINMGKGEEILGLKKCLECVKGKEDLEGWDDNASENWQCRKEERTELDNYTEISKQKDDLVEWECKTYEAYPYRDSKIADLDELSKHDELLEEANIVGDVQELPNAPFSEENSLKKGLHEEDLLSTSQLKQSMTLESLQVPAQQECMVFTDSLEEQNIQDVEKGLHQQEAEQKKSSGGLQKEGDYKYNDPIETTVSDFAENSHSYERIEDASSKATRDTDTQVYDAKQLDGNEISTKDLSAEVQLESRVLESDQSVRYSGGTQQDMIYLQGCMDEASRVSQFQDVEKRVETEEEHATFQEQQDVILSVPVGISQGDASPVYALKKEACETEKPELVSMEKDRQQNIVDYSKDISNEDMNVQQCNMAGWGDAFLAMNVTPSEYLSNGAQVENGYNISNELESEDGVEDVREALRAERDALAILYAELEQERNAAAIAAREAMAMISRLQEEKAAMQMEADHYQRMVKEKALYDQQALTLLKEILLKREKEKYALEKEVEIYRERLLKKKVEEMKKARIGRGNDVVARESRDSVLLLQGVEEQNIPTSEQQENNSSFDDYERNLVNINVEFNASSSKLSLNMNALKSEVDPGIIEDTSSLEVMAHTRADEGNGRFLKDILPVIHPLEHVETDVFSTEDEETRCILERLWFLEEQLKELKESEYMDPCNATSELHQLEGIHQSPESDASCSVGECIDELSGDYDSKNSVDSSPIMSEIRRTKALGDSLGSEFQGASEYDEDCHLADLPNAWKIQPKEASPLSCQIEEEDNFGDKISSVYEVRHGSKQSKYNAFECEEKDYHEHIQDRLGKPDLSPGNISEESSPGPEFVQIELPRRAKGRNLFCAHGSNSKAECDVCDNDESTYLSEEQSLGSIQQDFCTMVIRDKRQTITEEEVKELIERLQFLESDRDILRQIMNKHKNAGSDLLQEIMLHLRELKAVDYKACDTEDCLKQLEPLFNSMLEVSTPAIKKRRYAAESLQVKQTDVDSE